MMIEKRQERDIRAAFEHLAPSRLPASLIAEFRTLQAEHARLRAQVLDLPNEQEERLGQLTDAIRAAIPDDLVMNYLAKEHGYGSAARPMPTEIYWNTSAV